jgi:hypothetical protein
MSLRGTKQSRTLQLVMHSSRLPRYARNDMGLLAFAFYLIPYASTTWFSGRKLRTVLPACHNSLSRNSFNSASSFSR